MHFHICPTEVTALLVMWDAGTMYIVHYKHILLAQWHSTKCKVCQLKDNRNHE